MSLQSQSNQYQPHRPSTPPQPPTAARTGQSPTADVVRLAPCAADVDACGCQVSADDIRARAYQISQARSGGQGDAQTDWCQAEAELLAAAKAKV